MKWLHARTRRAPAPPATDHAPTGEASEGKPARPLVVLTPGPVITPARLRPLLPPSVALTERLTDPAPDCVIVEQADAARVRDARARYPSAALLAVTPPAPGPASVVSVFNAGADDCVELVDLREIAAHVLALLRRRAWQPAWGARSRSWP
jgi:hypothetical protein